jgi:hypothetical protein
VSSPLQEGHWESEYRRLVRRDRNWRLGLVSLSVPAASIQLTSIGSRSHSLPRSQGPCDSTQTSWDQSNKRVHRRHVSDRHELRLIAVSGSGMYPSSPLRRVLSHPLYYPQAQSHVSTIYLRNLSSLLDLAMSVEFSYGARSKTTGNLVTLWPVILMASELSRESPFYFIRPKADGRMNDKYLVSAGVDKVLVVWDFETGEKIARFGQQPNISAGLHLVQDKLISITIDGVVRTYDVDKGEMIRQFKISDLYKQLDLDTGDRKAVQDIGAGSGGSGMVQWASGSGSTVTVSPKCPKSPNTKLTFQCATKTLMVTMKWNEISADDVPPAKPASRRSKPSTLETPRILRSATTPTPSPITPQRQRMLSMKVSSATSSTFTPSPASMRESRARPIAASPAITRSIKSGSPSVSSRMTSSIGTTAATSAQSLDPVSTSPEKTVPKLVPDLSRVPQIIEVRRTPEVERGVFDPNSGRLVTSTRFAARAGSKKKIDISTGTTTNELEGAWTENAASLGLDTAAKRPTCLAVDDGKVVVSSIRLIYHADGQYGCSDGCIVVATFC